MSQRARIAIIAVAAVGLVLAFFAARGSDEADDPPAGGAAATQQQPAATAPQGAATVPQTTAGGAEAPATTPVQTTPVEIPLPVVRVRGGQPVGGVQELEFEEGERVRFQVRADAADEVHVHGFDVTKAVGPGRTTTFSFKADLTGRFEVELHDAGVQIASLRVSP